MYHDTSRSVIRITDITDLIITVYLPNDNQKTNAGIIVCPGGGYKYLAVNIEGKKLLHGLISLVLQRSYCNIVCH
ncbi:MAG: hypothetical protein ACR2KX_11750 [Chitinophagaceae bacterium]